MDILIELKTQKEKILERIGEEHIDPVPGDDLVLTIDMNVQSIVEK